MQEKLEKSIDLNPRNEITCNSCFSVVPPFLVNEYESQTIIVCFVEKNNLVAVSLTISD